MPKRGCLQDVYDAEHTTMEETVVSTEEIAKKYDLLTTGGSDFHGQYTKKPHPLGFCGCEIADVEAMLARK